jgi:Fe-S-cluster containining protein
MKKTLLARLYETFREHLGLNFTRIHPRVTRKMFLGRTSVRNCDGTCCHGGATVSVDERDRVLAHADLVLPEMTSRGRNDVSRWFDRRLTWDTDFTAGWTSGTRVIDKACIFLRGDRLCALQVAGEKHLGSSYALKPSVCLLWPLCIQDGALEVGYAWFTKRQECCAPVSRGGERTILQVMRPDENRMSEMTRPDVSRGGGPPRPRAACPRPEPPVPRGISTSGASRSAGSPPRGSIAASPRKPGRS